MLMYIVVPRAGTNLFGDAQIGEFFRGDRGIFRVGGGRHRIRIKYSDGTSGYENTFTLPLGPDIFLLSIPRMTSGAGNAIEVFIRQPESRNADEDKAEDNEIETEWDKGEALP